MGSVVAMMMLVATLLPKHRRAIHETVQLIAKVLLWVAIVGAVVVYFRRYG